jgi:phytoene dehydrogenase-like protein
MSGVPSVSSISERLEVGLAEPVARLAAREWDAVIVGGGHNGLTAAAYLARAGRSVLVLERRERLGGACTLERPFGDDWEMSPCAYVVGLLDRLVIDELELRRRGVEVRLADPELFIPLDGETAFVQWLDEDRTAAAMLDAGFAKRDVDGLRAYNQRCDRIRRLLRKGERDAWVGESPSREEIEAMLGGEPELIDVVFEASIADVLDEHFADDRIKDALYPQGLIAAYGGPRTPGTAAIHLMHHMGELDPSYPGSWGYVRGGMGAISLAIAAAAREAGAVLACGVPVGAIVPGEGIELEDGTRIRARQVVCNADPKVALSLLDGAGVPESFETRLREWRVRSPVVKLNARVDELPRFAAAMGEPWPLLGTVDCVEPLEAAQAAFDACERGEVRIAYAELYCQTAADPTPAPGGGHLVSAFCQFGPYEPAARGWDAPLAGSGGTVGENAARQVIDLIERHAPGFRGSIADYELLGPPDIEARIGLTGGNIFQGECFPDQMWDRRLPARTPVDGLYLCGAATHPGGSVIGLNGRNAAMAALADARISTAA